MTITRTHALIVLIALAILTVMVVFDMEDPAMPYCPKSAAQPHRCAGRR